MPVGKHTFLDDYILIGAHSKNIPVYEIILCLRIPLLTLIWWSRIRIGLRYEQFLYIFNYFLGPGHLHLVCSTAHHGVDQAPDLRKKSLDPNPESASHCMDVSFFRVNSHLSLFNRFFF